MLLLLRVLAGFVYPQAGDAHRQHPRIRIGPLRDGSGSSGEGHSDDQLFGCNAHQGATEIDLSRPWIEPALLMRRGCHTVRD